MKPLHPIEQIALTLFLALVCATATTRCTHANTWLSGDLREYDLDNGGEHERT